MMLFLALYLAVPILITVLVEIEYFGWSTFAVLVSLAALYFLHSTDARVLLREYGPWLPVGIPGYVALGVVWSFFKWWSYLMGFRRAYRETRDSFVRIRGSEPYTTDDMKRHFSSNLAVGTKYYSNIVHLRKPQAHDNKARIVAWIGFWPFSFVGTLLNDPVRRLCEFAFNRLRGTYQRLSNRIFREDVELQ